VLECFLFFAQLFNVPIVKYTHLKCATVRLHLLWIQEQTRGSPYLLTIEDVVQVKWSMTINDVRRHILAQCQVFSKVDDPATVYENYASQLHQVGQQQEAHSVGTPLTYLCIIFNELVIFTRNVRKTGHRYNFMRDIIRSKYALFAQ
jgi:hypothetical protein